jgi:hypothetical protein
MTCGAHIVSTDLTELSDRSLASACIPPLSEADVLRFDVFQFNANLRAAFADTPGVLIHCPVSYYSAHANTFTELDTIHNLPHYFVISSALTVQLHNSSKS